MAISSIGLAGPGVWKTCMNPFYVHMVFHLMTILDAVDIWKEQLLLKKTCSPDL